VTKEKVATAVAATVAAATEVDMTVAVKEEVVREVAVKEEVAKVESWGAVATGVEQEAAATVMVEVKAAAGVEEAGTVRKVMVVVEKASAKQAGVEVAGKAAAGVEKAVKAVSLVVRMVGQMGEAWVAEKVVEVLAEEAVGLAAAVAEESGRCLRQRSSTRQTRSCDPSQWHQQARTARGTTTRHPL